MRDLPYDIEPGIQATRSEDVPMSLRRVRVALGRLIVRKSARTEASTLLLDAATACDAVLSGRQ